MYALLLISFVPYLPLLFQGASASNLCIFTPTKAKTNFDDGLL